MKPTQHDLETRIAELQANMSESRSNIRLQESFLQEDLSALQAAQQTYNRRMAVIAEEKQLYALYDRELAELDGRLKEYTRKGTVRRPKVVKEPSVDDLVGILKGLDPGKLADLMNKLT